MADSSVPEPASVVLQVAFQSKEPGEIERRADATADPSGTDYGRHLAREEFEGLVLLPEEERALVVDWLAGHGMEVVESSGASGQSVYVEATPEQMLSAFGQQPAHGVDDEVSDSRTRRGLLTMPRHLAGYVHRVSLQPDPTGLFGKLPVASARQEPPPAIVEIPGGSGSPSETGPPAGLGGFTPSDIREIYEFPDDWDGTGETIALMMLGGSLEESDLHRFWRGHGIEPPQLTTVQVGPSQGAGPNPLLDLEATMTVEWAGAMAPGARIVVYFVDPAVVDDPWSAFLAAILWDEANAPTVVSTSWITPERKYYQRHGHGRVVGLLNEAAALGITVISASGDWGAFDGVPRVMTDNEYVSDAPWPHAVFPAVEERVLAVGGTMITNRTPLTEVGWSGPPPPGLQAALHFERIASSGGFSEEVAIPGWQRPVLRPYFPRGAGSPAVVPYGRGFPDVALAAAGPSILRENDTALSSQGYQAVTHDQWVDYAGGTSVAAPIWAAIIARANQARRQAGRSRVGFVNPLLYRLRDADPSSFRAINVGDGDVAMKAVDLHGRAVTFELHGYDSVAGWDPVTGLGVPRVSRLVELIRDSPPIAQVR